MELRTQSVFLVLATVSIVLVLGVSLMSDIPLITFNDELNAYEATTVLSRGWNIVSLNDTHGSTIARFEYAFYWETGSGSSPNLIPVKIGVPYSGGFHLVSLRMEFAPNGMYAPPELWFKTPGGYPFNPVHIYKDSTRAVVDIPDLGFIGTGSAYLDLMIQIDRNMPISYGYPLDLTVSLTVHDANPHIIGHAFTGEFMIPLMIDQAGNVTRRTP